MRYCMQVPKIPWLSLLWNRWCKWHSNQNYEKLDLQKVVKSEYDGGGSGVNHKPKLHKHTKGEGKKESHNHELSRIFLIYWNSLYYHKQSHSISPIMKQSIFNYEVTFFFLLAPIGSTKKSYYRHTPDLEIIS